MSDKDVEQEIEKLQTRVEKLQEQMGQGRDVVDSFVTEKPYMALGIVFLAGLTLGCIAGMMSRRD